MYCAILISIVIIALSHGQTCTSTCSYIYDNRTGNYTAATVKKPRDLYRNETVTTFRTGVYTVIGQFSCSEGKYSDYLRFRKRKGTKIIYQPLVIMLYNNYAEFYGKEWNSNGGWASIGLERLKSWTSGTEMSLQISDHVQDRYSIYLNTHSINYNYTNNWDTFTDRRLDTINNIYSDSYCMQYKYIMVCDDLKVNICDVSEPSEKLELGQSYSMVCGGTGSPLLETTWTVKYEFGENKDDLRSSISSVRTDRDDVIKSKIDIPNFSVEDIGQYTCTVSNKNYRNESSHTFTLSYIQPPKVTISSSPKFYKTTNLPLNFTWNITGWPLKNIKAKCTSTGSNSQELMVNKTRIDNYPWPLLIFKWNITSPTNATHIYCSITNNGEEIYSNTITRVGHSCRSGFSSCVIIGGSVSAFMLVIGVIIGVVIGVDCLPRMRRGKGLRENKEPDIDLSINVNSKGSNPIAKQDPELEPHYAENTLPDLDSAGYLQMKDIAPENTLPDLDSAGYIRMIDISPRR